MWWRIGDFEETESGGQEGSRKRKIKGSEGRERLTKEGVRRGLR
jgi:hypothetical protein